jgi:hypothetical protein
MVRILLPVFLMCEYGNGQPFPSFEVFGGYSHFRLSKTNVPGWNGSAAINTNRWFGILGDFSGHYFPETGSANFLRTETSQSDSYRFLLGPQLSVRTLGRITPRFHVLMGAVHTRTRASGIVVSGFPEAPERLTFLMTTSKTELTGGAGTSLDIRVTDRIGVRLIQIDYLYKSKAGFGRDSWRFGTGIVVRFGRSS